ncbi:60Kd inner membrane protein-domain-containing protein [Mortierella sp. GBAus27b]|nr:60Kd inner membrane protein-domain-containing protein [Mortierella sp. GBAus27b]
MATASTTARYLLASRAPYARLLRTRILPSIVTRGFSGSRSLQDSHDRLSQAVPEIRSDTISLSTDSNVVSGALQEPAHINTLLLTTHHILEGIHAAGLPWWATIFCATFALRTAITTPVAIYQQRALGRMMALTPVLQSWLHTLKTTVTIDHKLKGRDMSTFNKEIESAYRAKVNELYSANRCNPRVSFLLPWVQIPLFITMSLAIRGMAGYPLPFLGDSSLPAEPGFTDGGILWFTDLTASDPTWIMPIAVGATNLLNVEVVYCHDLAFNCLQ